jgi:hypothetical protein
MRKPIAMILLLILAASNTWAASFVGTPPPGNWNKVQSLPQGADLTIEMKHKQEITGEFIRLDNDSIVIRELDRERIYPKDSVVRVKLMRPGSRARKAGILGGLLFGAGFGIGYAGASYALDYDNAPAAERAKFGAIVGALAGGAGAAIALMHLPEPHGELIYRAR